MVRVFLGLVVLSLLLLAPVIRTMTSLILDMWEDYANWLYPALNIIFGLGMSVLIVSIFLKRTQLHRRLPKPIPGANTLMIGSVLWLVIPGLIALLAWLNVLPGLVVFVARNGIVFVPALAFLMTGFAQVLFSATSKAAVLPPAQD